MARQRVAFNYCNMWSSHDQFKDIVLKCWQRQVPGCLMYQLMLELKMLKTELQKLAIFLEEVNKISGKLQVAQDQLQADPSNELKQHEELEID